MYLVLLYVSAKQKVYRFKILNISYRDRKTNDYVRQKIEELEGKQERILQVVKRRKLQWYGHITRHDSLAKTIFQGTVEGGRKRGKPRKSWLSNIKEWTQMDVHSLLSSAQDRQLWRSLCKSTGTPTT